MRYLLAVIVMVLVLAGACGSAADPYLGEWSGQDVELRVSGAEGDYRAEWSVSGVQQTFDGGLLDDGRMTFSRVVLPDGSSAELELVAGEGRLTATITVAGLEADVELTRLSR